MNLAPQTTVHLFMPVIYIIILYIYDQARVRSKVFLSGGAHPDPVLSIVDFLSLETYIETSQICALIREVFY